MASEDKEKDPGPVSRSPSPGAGARCSGPAAGGDPHISLEGKPAQWNAEASAELLERLRAQAPGNERYTVQEEIARGGMGVVLKVRDQDLRRTLAMKVALVRRGAVGGDAALPMEPSDLARFLDEAQVTGQLDHPGIVPVHELGLDREGRVYFTMRLVQGRDLRQIIELVHADAEGWSLTKALGVILRVCEAMAYAHSRGVIHRDLKPANVMVGRFGETYVMDWGLAKVLGREDLHNIRPRHEPDSSRADGPARHDQDPGDEAPLRTMDGTTIGTPSYIAPEQARGEVDRVGVRSDVYSVGAMLYHLLCGRAPYSPAHAGVRASPHSVLDRVIAGPPEPLHHVRSGVPAELAAICEKAMARSAERRYADTQAMAEDLQAFLDGRVVRAWRTGAVAELSKWFARNRTVAVAGLTAIVAVVTGLLLVVIVQQQATVGLLRRQYVANVHAADASLLVNDCSAAKRLLEDCDPPLRGWEWEHLMFKADTSLQVLDDQGARVNCVAFSPDGRSVAAAGHHGEVRVLDLASGDGPRESARLAHGSDIYAMAFSPDGRLIASGADDRRILVWDSGTARVSSELTGHTRGLLSLAFSPDGRHLASGADDNTVRIWNLASGDGPGVPAAPLVLLGHDSFVASVAFSPDGEVAASASNDGTIRLWRASTGEPLRVLRGHADCVRSVTFSPDGERLASGSVDRTIRVWCARTGAPLRVQLGHTEEVRCVAFSLDGALLASGSDDRTIRVWDAHTGALRAIHRGHDRTLRAVAFSPDGTLLASASLDGTVRLWDATATELSFYRGHDDAVTNLAFSPDGSRVASIERGGLIKVWELSSLETLAVLRGQVGVSLAFSPDGTELAAGTMDGTIRIWDARSWDLARESQGHEGPIPSLAYSPSGSCLASAGTDTTIRLWDGGSGEALSVLRGHAEPVNSLAFSQDGSRLASGSQDGTICIWAPAPPAPTGPAAKPLSLRATEKSVTSVAFSTDGSLVASASDDRRVSLWDARTGVRLLTLPDHGGPVRWVAFSPDGSRLASGADDCTIRLWSLPELARAEAAQDMLVLRGQDETWNWGAFSPGGSTLASACEDGAVWVWKAGPASPRHDPAERAPARSPESGDDPLELANQSWRLVRYPAGARSGYQLGLELAREAVRLSPDDPICRRSLGAALYRDGQYEHSLRVLEGVSAGLSEAPLHLAFLAMAQQELGQRQAAELALTELLAARNSTSYAYPVEEAMRVLLIEAGAKIAPHDERSSRP